MLNNCVHTGIITMTAFKDEMRGICKTYEAEEKCTKMIGILRPRGSKTDFKGAKCPAHSLRFDVTLRRPLHITLDMTHR